MSCGEDAAFTKRLEANDKRIEVIGGSDKYMAVCRNCWHSNKEKGNFCVMRQNKIIIFFFSSNPATISAKCELRQHRICQGKYSQRRNNCVKLSCGLHLLYDSKYLT